ncbi:alpha/beta hydrolase [Streptomyces sp. NBC_01142]|uniref:alpha/beta hydrolase n=1 Tax=Streptomyces sp. NBC_01142 TaxID=2975865 RepID=UPI0022581AF8|nr:alpha/beta hydrolase [Streptomyces sp. NBC_01142]MCX4820002.1 alpha/beta hydrolase [Streptomyces sp. NBC_01142]
MRAVAKYGAVASLSSLVLTTFAVAPADGATATTTATASAEFHGTALAAGRAAAAGITFGRCPKAEMLPAPVQCGTVEVPLDYAAPSGRRITLTVSRVRASGKPAERQGALVYNPGGPGASSMDFPLIATRAKWKRIARAYDIVGYSPRGVGRSAPLSCQDPDDFTKAPTLAPSHPSPSYKRERIARAQAYAQGCARNAGPALRHYTSLNNARDLEVLRAALGEQQLTFMGASYGTYFGALYATLFPSHVRRMVFDSAVNPAEHQVWYRNNLDQSLAFESRWGDFRAWVAKHDATYHLGATPEEVSHSYEQVRARLAAEPAGGRVGPGQLHAAFLSAGYYDGVWPPRATALSEYLKGNAKPLIDQAAPKPGQARESENGNAVYTAVMCNDAPWPTDWAVWDRDNSDLARLAPFETWDNAWMNLPCAYWLAPRQQPLDVRTKKGALPPTLILAAERDAATPYEGARELSRRLQGSVLITERDAGTHGIGGGSNDCVNAHLENYLLHGKTPVRRAECAPHPEPDPVSLDRWAAQPKPPLTV